MLPRWYVKIMQYVVITVTSLQDLAHIVWPVNATSVARASCTDVCLVLLPCTQPRSTPSNRCCYTCKVQTWLQYLSSGSFWSEAFVPRRDLWTLGSTSRDLIKLKQEASCRVRWTHPPFIGASLLSPRARISNLVTPRPQTWFVLSNRCCYPCNKVQTWLQ